ncbi:hypothetical protein PVL29_004862 [Vitis rotundifolia]|uniref:Pentatricopeptide repeat-containing protein n=1 Tax=Vitis rotundifolia TaxID=103349 RepID=A0AA39AA30_VITRO|nr:hypothetical protein PVL29_004862 [Vitis rotundifolia]
MEPWKFVPSLDLSSTSRQNTPPNAGPLENESYQIRLILLQNLILDGTPNQIGDMLKVQDLNVILRHFGKLCSSYIKFMGKSLNPIKALEIYNSIHDESIRNNVSICNSILSFLVRNGKFESSLKLFHQMKQDGLRPEAVTYSTTLELVQEMERSRLPKDILIYGTFLAVCASNNCCREADNYFNQMKDECHLPNVFHYSSLLNNYSADGDYKKAFMLVILTTLLKLYVRGGLFEKSRELLMPYCLLMDGIAKSRHILKVKSIFEEMKKKKKTTFCRGGLLKEAKQFARDFEATDDILLLTFPCHKITTYKGKVTRCRLPIIHYTSPINIIIYFYTLMINIFSEQNSLLRSILQIPQNTHDCIHIHLTGFFPSGHSMSSPMVVMVQLYCLFFLLSLLQFLGRHYYLVPKLYHSYPTHPLPGSLVQIVHIHPP